MTYEEQYAKALAKLAEKESELMRRRFGNRMETAADNARYKAGGAKGAAVKNERYAKQKED